MPDSRLEEMDRRIAEMRKRLNAAESIRQAIADDPQLIDMLVAANGEKPAKSKGGSSFTRSSKGSRQFRGGPVAQAHFQKVAQYLESDGNKPQTIPKIAAAVGLKPSNVIQVCYRTHAALVESLPVPGHRTKKQWRLRPKWRELLAAKEE